MLVVRPPFGVAHDAEFQICSRYCFRNGCPAAPYSPWWLHYANAIENQIEVIQNLAATAHESAAQVELTDAAELLVPDDGTGAQIEKIDQDVLAAELTVVVDFANAIENQIEVIQDVAATAHESAAQVALTVAAELLVPDDQTGAQIENNQDVVAADLTAGQVDLRVDQELVASYNQSDPALSTSAAVEEEVVEVAAEGAAIQSDDFIQLDQIAVDEEADDKASSYTLSEFNAHWGNALPEDRVSASISSASGSSVGDQTEAESSGSRATTIATTTMAIKDMLPSFTNKEIVMYKQELSSGSYGRVYMAISRLGRIAIKTLKAEKMATLTPGQVDMHINNLYEEANLLYGLRHPNILTFYMMISDFENGYPGMATELMSENSLYHCIQRGDNRIRSWAGILNVAQQVVEAMVYLHDDERSIVHFDLKSCNILVEYDSSNPTYPICRVGDFGSAMVNKRGPLNNGRIPLSSSRGTVIYMAPEVILAKYRPNQITFVTEKVDVYSFAMLMWELVMGEVPYKGMPTEQVEINVVQKGMRPPMPVQYIWGWQGLMKDCWAVDEILRPNFKEIRARLNDIILQYNHHMSMNARHEFRN